MSEFGELGDVRITADGLMYQADKLREADSAGKFGAADIVRYILENYQVGRTDDGLPFAVPLPGMGPRHAVEIRALSSRLSASIWHDMEKAVGRDMMGTALNTIEGMAHVMDQTPVAMRAVYQRDSETMFLDLGDDTGRIVRVTCAGWAIEDPSEDHPLFRRNGVMKALPTPVKGGSMDELRELLKLDVDDVRWKMVRGWLTAALFEDRPRPILWAKGPQGSGKSTRARMVHNVIEPRNALGAPVTQEKDAATAAKQRFLLSFDNVSTISQGMSDWLCRLVTGAEDDRRQLMSDDTLRAGFYRRSAVATSITLPNGLRSDAVERLVIVPFERMQETARASEAQLWDSFAEAHGRILGALLDDIAKVLRHLVTAQEDETRARPRMADYANVLIALDIAYGVDDDTGHLAAYVNTTKEALADRALDDPLALAVLQVVADSGGQWEGLNKELLAEIKRRVSDDAAYFPKWVPQSPRQMGAQLDVMSETLRPAGVNITKGKRTKRGFPVLLTATRDLSELELSSEPLRNRPAGNGPGIFAQ